MKVVMQRPRVTKLRVGLVILAGAWAVTLALALPHRPPHGTGTAAGDQGCVNQGSDRRMFAPVVCWAQRQLSWKSDHEPWFVLLGRPQRAHLGLAWPPYLVVNWPDDQGRWRVFRIGFRYDRTWRGYIFPTLALKRLPEPLRY